MTKDALQSLPECYLCKLAEPDTVLHITSVGCLGVHVCVSAHMQACVCVCVPLCVLVGVPVHNQGLMAQLS